MAREKSPFQGRKNKGFFFLKTVKKSCRMNWGRRQLSSELAWRVISGKGKRSIEIIDKINKI